MPSPCAPHPSRHWFDLTRLAAHDIGRVALADRELLEDVVRHKTVFFDAPYANYDQCLYGRLRLVPDDDQLPGLQADYDAMRAAALVTDDAPEFDAQRENSHPCQPPVRADSSGFHPGPRVRTASDSGSDT